MKELLNASFSLQQHDPETKRHKRQHKQRQRLAQLNMFHSQQQQQSKPTPNQIHQSDIQFRFTENEFSSLRESRQPRISGSIVFPTNTVSSLFNSATTWSMQPRVQEEEFDQDVKTLLSTCEDTLSAKKRSLRMQLRDAEALNRCDFNNRLDIDKLKKDTYHLQLYLNKLTKVSKHYHCLEGSIFQQLLQHPTVRSANGFASSTTSMSRVIRSPSSSTRTEAGTNSVPVILTEEEMEDLIHPTCLLISLLRIKIEDDNDLNLARKSLKENWKMFEELTKLSKQKNIDEYSLIQQLLRN